MKRFVDILKAVCSIGTAIMIYMTIMRAVGQGEDIILYVLASVFALAFSASLFVISSLIGKVDILKSAVQILADDDEGYDGEQTPAKECPVCHAYIDGDEAVCPHCGGSETGAGTVAFATDDPDYRGTDFSGEELVSAHAPDDADI